MSSLTDIQRNITTLDAEAIEKLASAAYQAGHEGNEFAKGVDYCIAYLGGDFEIEELLEHIE